MKNPIATIKHLWKDPINTIEEADARKKEIMPWLIGSAVLAVAGMVLGTLLLSLLTILGIVGILGVMMFAFLLFIIKKAKEKFKALTCNKCNVMAKFETQEDYEKYVFYEVTKNEIAPLTVFAPKANDQGIVSEISVSAHANAVALITLTCPSCGEKKQLVYTISPFKCSCKEKKVHFRDAELVRARLEASVKEVVEDYPKGIIPYTVHSIHHPNNANKAKAGAEGATVGYKGVSVTYHRTPEELVEGFFLHNELNGTIKEVGEDVK